MGCYPSSWEGLPPHPERKRQGWLPDNTTRAAADIATSKSRRGETKSLRCHSNKKRAVHFTPNIRRVRTNLDAKFIFLAPPLEPDTRPGVGSKGVPATFDHRNPRDHHNQPSLESGTPNQALSQRRGYSLQTSAPIGSCEAARPPLLVRHAATGRLACQSHHRRFFLLSAEKVAATLRTTQTSARRGRHTGATRRLDNVALIIDVWRASPPSPCSHWSDPEMGPRNMKEHFGKVC